MDHLIVHIPAEQQPLLPAKSNQAAWALLALGALALLLISTASHRVNGVQQLQGAQSQLGQRSMTVTQPIRVPINSQRPNLPQGATSFELGSPTVPSSLSSSTTASTLGSLSKLTSWMPVVLGMAAITYFVRMLKRTHQQVPAVVMASATAQEEEEPDLYDLKFMTLEGDGMPCLIDKGRVPIKAYTKEIEPDCYQQLLDLANSPVPVGHVSCMPDVHLGKGATVGSVFASDQYVAPMAVGVDIGCGMVAIPVDGLYRDDPKLTMDFLTLMQKTIKKRIPTGNGPEGNRDSPVDNWKEIMDQITAEHPPTDYLKKAMMQPVVGKQMGTLGGGNHFIEVLQNESDGQIWLMVHSGSRRIGNETANYYDRIAKQQMKKKGRKVYGQLHYLDTDSKEGQAYLQDMSWCQGYALNNRQTMMKSLADVVKSLTGHAADMSKVINVHHNYCVCEECTYYDYELKRNVTKKLWITRKGATSAKKGQWGIIPGSMGVGSYIVKGRGNPDSWQSCSHGAGRKMSRTRAKKVIDQERFESTLEGVVCDRNPSLRDEAPDAYKDLTTVMKNQESLIEVVHRLLPVVNVKGF